MDKEGKRLDRGKLKRKILGFLKQKTGGTGLVVIWGKGQGYEKEKRMIDERGKKGENERGTREENGKGGGKEGRREAESGVRPECKQVNPGLRYGGPILWTKKSCHGHLGGGQGIWPTVHNDKPRWQV